MGSMNGMDSARLTSPCQLRSMCSLVRRIYGQVMVKSVVNAVAYAPL